jgi:hypothetical protein
MNHRTLFVAAVAVVLAACSSSSSGESSSGSSGGSSCPALTNLCQRLPVSAVESACGTGYTDQRPIDTTGAGPVNACGWAKNVSTKDELNITVTYRCLDGVDGHQYFESLRSSTKSPEALTGVGDEAFFSTDGAPFQQATVTVRVGQKVVGAVVNFPDPAPCSADQAKAHLVAVAQKVLALTP